ncbi:hypothetical protein ACLBKU_17680 [Erythrobacter sp. NE805]|uniref:hypothetical protein n=1 Tax=Erythrobacter sp. NE805 TaxID=3389875 RepID=UPI00396B247E
MKLGTHNLGPSPLARTTMVKVEEHQLTLTAFTPSGMKSVIITAEQAELLKDVLS